MSKFTNTPEELNRLCGMEPEFNSSRWGMACIAYIAGNSTCTSETATATGTVRAMSLEMIKNLDAEGARLADFKNAEIEAAYTEAVKKSQSDSSETDSSKGKKE